MYRRQRLRAALVPEALLSLPALTEKDRTDVRFAVEAGVDYIALSFVQSAADVLRLKRRIAKLGADVPVIAKIEKPEAIEEQFRAPEWPQGQLYAESQSSAGHGTLRVIIPEYYKQACLACHGGPKSEMDITGYPKEGGQLGELAGAISITLRQS